MKCPGCQHENPPQAKFCLECGARVALTCTKCRSELPAGAKFCLECGAPVASAATAEARFTSPESYTPKHLAEKILTSKAALEGERKQVTVLFADLKGSMELLAGRDPEEARKILDPVLELMMEAVHRYEGTVNQVMGDGIMALFGAPVAHEDHGVRACYAALQMQGAVGGYAGDLRRSQGLDVQIRIGLNSGEVVVRSIGSDLRMDYTAVGQTTHLAARMEQFARPGTTLMTGDTLRLCEERVQVNPLGPMPVKGLGEPVEVYEVTGAGAVRTRFQAAAARGLTRFVGRDAEVEQLRSAWEKAGQGHGQVVAVVGEPGIGKSRLFFEFTRARSAGAWLVLESGSVSYGKATAYLPIIDLLKAYFQIEARDEARKVREKVSGKLVTLEAALLPTLPAFLALLDIPVEDAQWQALDPPQRRQRTLDAVKRLLLRESQVQPLLLLFEDLHWIDSETQVVLDSLVGSLPTTRILLLVNYRPEYGHGWGSKTYYRQLQITALPPESAEELLVALLGDDTALEPLKRILIERTEGSPFFLEESVRTLIETKVLTGERGAHRLGMPVEQIQVPATVQAVLAARVDRLPPQEKSLLQMAAVIGKDVPGAVLRIIGDLPEPDFQRGLAHLQAAEFLYETSLFPEAEYTFKHALTHEVVYGSLLLARRRALHARIARAIEQLYADRLIEQAERLAYHALRGEEWSRAAKYSLLAGGRAMAHARYAAGAALYEMVIRAIDHQGEGADLSLKLDACLELWVARVESGLAEGFEELGEQAEALARALDDRQRLAQVRVRQAQGSWVIWLRPDGLATAIERSREAFDLAVPSDLRTRSYARFLAGAASLALGRLRDAIGEFDAGVELFPATPVDRETQRSALPIRANLRAFQAEAYAALGEFGAALRSAAEAQQIANEIDHPQSRWLASAYSGHVLLAKGEIDAATRMYASGLAIAKDRELIQGVGVTSLGLAHCRFLVGRGAEGMKSIPDNRTPGGTLGQFLRSVGRYGVLPASTYLAAGLLDEAEAEIAHGLALATAVKARAYQVPLFRLRAEALSMRGFDHRDEAGRYWRQSLELATDLGMRPELAHAHLGLARLLRNAGAHEQAREHLTTATTMYREMDMTYWLEKAEAELPGVS
jgi:class 3 adenylate cyclase/tetratricopeptide (TPR) repeat protein